MFFKTMHKKVYKLDEIIGMSVITSEAKKIGKIDSITFDETGAVQFIIKLENGEERLITQENILAIGDVMLVKPYIESPSSSELQKRVGKVAKKSQELICSSCGFINRPNAKYCTNCGEKLVR